MQKVSFLVSFVLRALGVGPGATTDTSDGRVVNGSVSGGVPLKPGETLYTVFIIT